MTDILTRYEIENGLTAAQVVERFNEREPTNVTITDSGYSRWKAFLKGGSQISRPRREVNLKLARLLGIDPVELHEIFQSARGEGRSLGGSHKPASGGSTPPPATSDQIPKPPVGAGSDSGNARPDVRDAPVGAGKMNREALVR